MFTFSFSKKRKINKIKYQGLKKHNFEYCTFDVDKIYDWCDSDSNSILKLNSKFNKKMNNKLVLNQIIHENNLDSILPTTTIIKNGILFFNPGESAGMQKGSNAIGILDLINLEAKRIFF